MDYKQILREKIEGYKALNEMDLAEARSRTVEERLSRLPTHLALMNSLRPLTPPNADAQYEFWQNLREKWFEHVAR